MSRDRLAQERSSGGPGSLDSETPNVQHSANGEGWQLFRGDAVSVMRGYPDSAFAVTICDPPYEAEAHTEQRRQKGRATRPGGDQVFRAVNAAALDFAPITAELREAAALQIARVTQHCALVFCQVEAVPLWRDSLEAGGMEYRRAISWTKPDAMPSLHGRWPGQAFEAIVLAMKPGARPCPIGGKAVSYTCVRESHEHRGGEAPHPTTKPLRLMRQIAEHFTMPGDRVLDCFAGSGTTGVACRQLGRRFVGVELAACAQCPAPAEWDCRWLDAKERPRRAYLCDDHRALVSAMPGFSAYRDNYFEIACRRLRGDEARPRPEQPSLFDVLTPRSEA